ncbi:MAG: translation initiation factor IF-2 [Alphaproteobacteria bacterium]|nr:MAG: translation initiation factor IF-2 [Alphaproteobacteria bacterium]
MAAESKEKERKKLSLSDKGTLSLKSTPQALQDKAPSSGRGVAVEVRRKRSAGGTTQSEQNEQKDHHLTDEEREARLKALQGADKDTAEPAVDSSLPKPPPIAEAARKKQEDDRRRQEAQEAREKAELEKQKAEAEAAAAAPAKSEAERIAEQQAAETTLDRKATGRKTAGYRVEEEAAETEESREKKKLATPVKRGDRRRDTGRLTVTQALNRDFDGNDRMPSLAAQRRAREKERMRMSADKQKIEHTKQVREVTIPEAITVQELANRMAERVGDVVKKLMEMGVMATANQPIDTDTAELIVTEFGHQSKRVSESDVEEGLMGEEDDPSALQPRPPVVTIMGHVDHGKTSLLDAIREADIAAHEAGGITQHIGAYQITMDGKQKITFLDTPGHAAFTEMRARGADVTDLVVLVVAANDGIKPQTIEAISHAKAAGKPIIVAVNKCDLEDADPDKVRQELLQYEVQVESFGGEVQCIEVSAKTKKGLKELEEAILLQSEILELKANPDRTAVGAVIESKLEQGRGSVATVLIQRGTLQVGDIFVSGPEWGKVRALTNDHGKKLKKGVPGQPVEVQGLNGLPNAGDDFVVVQNESRAREIAEFRTRRNRALAIAKTNRTGLEHLMHHMEKGNVKELNVVIKADVHGSVEAIMGSLTKLTEDHQEVRVNILHGAAGGITESDVTLAHASDALILGFNVRANAQARELARKEGVEIRYYSVIYEAIDDIKDLLSGLLSPEVRESQIGYAEIRQVFQVSKVGKVAGCMVTEGIVKRGAGVRLLRDDVVIHEGKLKTLRRFKDEVKDVREGYECGMAFENYDDVKEGDIIEVFEKTEHARELE